MDICIHPGMHKTATTYLQTAVFDQHPEISNIGKPVDDYTTTELEFVRRIRLSEYPYKQKRCDTLFQKIVEGTREDHLLMISWEGFWDTDPEVVFSRLANHFENPFILATIRNPITAIKSFYLQWLRGVPRKHSYLDFDEWLNNEWDTFKNSWEFSKFERFEYATYDRIFKKFTPSEKVKFLPYEKVSEDEEAFLNDITRFLRLQKSNTLNLLDEKNENQSNKNTRQTNLMIWYKKIRSNVQSDVVNSLIKAVFRRLQYFDEKASVELSEDWRKRIIDTFSSDLEVVQQTYDADLRTYGYDV